MKLPIATQVLLGICLCVLALANPSVNAQPDDLDLTFDPGTISYLGNPGAFMYATAIQPDGKVLIGGVFDTVQGAPRVFVARLNTNGSLDTTFVPLLQTLTATGGGEVYDLLVQPDGKILVAGYFRVGGVYKTLVRLEANGALDSSFNVTLNDGSYVYRMVLQPDGKVIIGSNSMDTVNGVTTGSVARLNPNGTLDSPLGVLGDVVNIGLFALALQSDGKILVGGNSSGGTVLVRLNPTGERDSGFAPPAFGLTNVIDAVAVQQDGKILVGGRQAFTVNGTLRDGLIRLNTNGSHDPTFDRDDVDIRNCYSLLVESDGKIAVGGLFTVNFGLAIGGFGRLYPDGSLDFVADPGPDNDVFDIARQTDGKLIIAGPFRNFFALTTPDSWVRYGVARILVGPSIPGAPATKLKVEGGNVLVGSPGRGLILKSTGGTCVKIGIDNTGALTSATVTCP